MKKLNLVFVFLSVVFLVLGTVPSVFGQIFDLEISHFNIDETEDNSDLSLIDTPPYQEDMVSQEAENGMLYAINASPYCLDIYIDEIKAFDNLPAGYSLRLRGVPQGTHALSAVECNSGSSIVSWGPKSYEQRILSVQKIRIEE